jgi:hypothetical protein
VRPPFGRVSLGGVDAVVEGVDRVIKVDRVIERSRDPHEWIPHSVLPVPAQRPLRGSSPGATREVHGQQPIDG